MNCLQKFAEHPVSHSESQSLQTRSLLSLLDGPVKHHVILITVHDFVRVQLHSGITNPLQVIDWMALPAHVL